LAFGWFLRNRGNEKRRKKLNIFFIFICLGFPKFEKLAQTKPNSYIRFSWGEVLFSHASKYKYLHQEIDFSSFICIRAIRVFSK
jgi:hypothetical protein